MKDKGGSRGGGWGRCVLVTRRKTKITTQTLPIKYINISILTLVPENKYRRK